MKNALILMLGLSLSLVAFGCGDDDDSETTEGEAGFTAGSFVVTVEDVSDGCFDGAMDIIVLPDNTARPLPAPVAIPAYGDLPATTDIEFSQPFQSAPGAGLKASGDNGLTTDGSISQTGVSIVADGQDCLADMDLTFTLVASDNDTMTGTGSISITNTVGADCPVFQTGPPCEVTSNLSAVRQ